MAANDKTNLAPDALGRCAWDGDAFWAAGAAAMTNVWVEKILLASQAPSFVRRDGHLPSPSTMNASESVDLARMVSASFWVGELYQACAFSMLSNSMRASRSGATPSSPVMLPVRII